MKFLRKTAGLIIVFSASLAAANLNLKPATVKVWNDYLQQAEGKVNDAPPLKTSTERSSTVRVVPATGAGTTAVPNGLIHDWIGTTFVRNASMAQLQAVIHDYDHYKDIYAPTVVDSKALETGNTRETFSMEWFRKVMNITTGIDADYSNTQVAKGTDRGYVVTRSIRVQEVRNLGTENEQKLPADTGSGFIWRICSILRYEQADGGVYLRLEAIVLSRDIPHTVRWLANPIVNHLSRSSVEMTLAQTSEAVQTRSAKLTGDALAQAR